MTEIITYRLIGTGVWGFEFFDSGRSQVGFVRNGMSRSFRNLGRRGGPGSRFSPPLASIDSLTSFSPSANAPLGHLSDPSPVRIEGEGISWYSRFGLDSTIVPGTSRKVKDTRTGEEIFRIIYWQPGLYQVRPVIGNSAG